MEKAKLSRRQRDRKRHKEEIMTSALSLFSEKGFHNVSMQDIANASEFGTGTLYNFFESKEQLFVELIGAGIARFAQVLFPILDSKETEQTKLSNFILAHADLIESNIEYFKLYISQYGTTAPRSPAFKAVTDLKKAIAEKLVTILKKGIKKKVFKPVPPEITALSIRATLEAFTLESSENFDKALAEQGFSNIDNFFLDLLKNTSN